jgi:hypothetical protein
MDETFSMYFGGENDPRLLYDKKVFENSDTVEKRKDI